MGGRGMAAGAVVAAVIGAVGVIVAALITVWGGEGGGPPGPGSISQTNERGDNHLCVGDHNVCGDRATTTVPASRPSSPRGSSGE
ncbi:hypothetical protein RB200_29450 [Streptomyces sp. PmtG]